MAQRGGVAQALQSENVARRLAVGKYPRVRQLELLEGLTHVGRLRLVEREVHVEGVDTLCEEMGRFRIAPGGQGVAGPPHGQDGDIVTGPSLGVALRTRGQINSDRRLGKPGPKV